MHKKVVIYQIEFLDRTFLDISQNHHIYLLEFVYPIYKINYILIVFLNIP